MCETLVAIFLAYSNSGITSGKKVRSNLKMAAILKMPTYYAQVQFDTRYEIIPNYARKSIFGGDDVIDDVTGWPQSSPSVFPYKWKMNIFLDHWKTNNDIIIEFGFHRNHSIVNMSLWISVERVIDDVIRSQNISKFWIAIILWIFEQ